MPEREPKNAAETAAYVKAYESEALRNKAEAEQLKSDARKLKAEAEQHEVGLRKLLRAEEAELARDHNNQVYVFDSAVGPKSVEACIQKLGEWDRTKPNCDIEIIFNSPGGSIVDGMALFDYIQRIKRNGHAVTTTTMGMAASMAGILLQAGDVRKMGPEAWLLIHQASFGAGGSYGEVEDMLKWVEKVQERILDIFAKRAKESGAKNAMNRAQIKRKWHRTDWWLSSDEALDYGFVDLVE